MTLALVHTSPVLIPAFNSLCAQYLPDTPRFHIVDESLIRNTIRAGRLEPGTVRRVGLYVQSARDAGADVVLVTCSSIGPAVTAVRPQFDFPVLRIDEAMAAQAVGLGRRIGVLATLQTTLEPTLALVRETAAAAGRSVELQSRLCEGAFEAVLRGDTERHDSMVLDGLTNLLAESDVVVLAQASMARVVDRLPSELRGKPVLSSPEMAIQQTTSVIRSLSAPVS